MGGCGACARPATIPTGHVSRRGRGEVGAGGAAVAEAGPDGAGGPVCGRGGEVRHEDSGGAGGASGGGDLAPHFLVLVSKKKTSPLTPSPLMHLPRVVIVGGGQGGVNVAQGLAGTADVTLVDR